MRKQHVVLGSVLVALCAAVGLLGFLLVRSLYEAATEPDTQCSGAPSAVLAGPTTASGWLALGDEVFDRGDCEGAVAAYTKAIDADPAYAAAYNNRAYTRMRQQRYDLALPDLDRAIALRPDYVNALMNRGDIRNYYYEVDRAKAIADYDRVIALGPAARQGTSVCGHRLIAKQGGWSPGLYLQIAAHGVDVGCAD